MREVLAALKLAAGDPLDAADARGSMPDQARSSSRGAGLPCLTPLPGSSGSAPRPQVSQVSQATQLAPVSSPVPPVEDSLSPPLPPPTLAGTPAPRRRPLLPTYAIAAAAAVGGGALVLALGGRARQEPTGPTRVIESVFVPVAAPAGVLSVTESNPLAGIRLVRIESNPPGARVTDRGTEVCLATPCQIVLRGMGVEAEYRLQLTRFGYKPALLVVGPKDEAATATLEAGGGEGPIAAAAATAAQPSAAAPDAPPIATEAPAPTATEAPAPAETAAAIPLATAAPAPAAQAPAAGGVMHFQDGMNRPAPVSVRAPVYTREAREAKVQGTVIAKCVITPSGSLSGCRVIKGLPHMDGAVIAALSASRYTPVMYQGRAVSVDYAFTIKLVPP
jgi:TonB family protein